MSSGPAAPPQSGATSTGQSGAGCGCASTRRSSRSAPQVDDLEPGPGLGDVEPAGGSTARPPGWDSTPRLRSRRRRAGLGELGVQAGDPAAGREAAVGAAPAVEGERARPAEAGHSTRTGPWMSASDQVSSTVPPSSRAVAVCAHRATGRGRTSSDTPRQTKLMPSVTTIDGRLRRWISAPSSGIDADRRRAAPATPKQRRLAQPGGGDAADEADEGADRQVEFVAGDDEHLRDRRQRDRDRQVEHQVEAEIADGARIEPGDGDQHQRQRQRRQQRAQQPRAARRAELGRRRGARRAESAS